MIDDMTYDRNAAPRLYVGTYAAYNAGSLKGAWLDLEDFADADAFYEKAREIHASEDDPEFMFQDFEGFPRAFYSESRLDDRLWDWIEADEDDREVWAVALYGIDSDIALEDARDAFVGCYDSEADWAESFLEDTGALQNVPQELRHHINFESYARDARLGGDMTFIRHNGEVWAFWNH